LAGATYRSFGLISPPSQNGLLSEVRCLHSISRNATSQVSDSDADDVDYTLGIYQSIGYKEFHEYISSTSPTEKGFQEAVENMKTSTRQYSKRQISWIRNKLSPAIHAANRDVTTVSMYMLDATNDTNEDWTSKVRDPAIQITEEFLNSNTLPDPLMLSELARKMLQVNIKPVDPTSVLNAQRKVICPTCTFDTTRPVMIDEERFAAHLRGRAHRRLAQKMTKERQPEQEAQRAKRLERVSKVTVESDSDIDMGPGTLFS